MSLAQRVRDIRYAKGWGPDELANRAEISRTALYQIESGKTGLPRAGTLRRIAVALEVPMEDLLGFEDEIEVDRSRISERPAVAASPRFFMTGHPPRGGRCRCPTAAAVRPISIATAEESRFAVESEFRPRPTGTRRCTCERGS